MAKHDQDAGATNSEEVSVVEIFSKIKSGVTYILRKWLTILSIGLLGGVLGVGYSFIQKPLYTAACSFVLESGGKSGGVLGQYAGLASLAGIDLTGGGGGVFEGDNIIELYKSRTMIEKTLLSPVVLDGKSQLLIDRYVDFNKLRPKWKKRDKIDTINFFGDPGKFSRKQDSLISKFAEIFNMRWLTVSRIDKRLNIIKVQFSGEDELFAKTFTSKLVETVNEFYVQTKTKKTYQNVAVLQRQADSVHAALNASITGVASSIDAAPNANPSLLTLRVPSQRKQVDVQTNGALYAEIVKNLEISKISLRQETPLIQVIDEPVLPLKVDKMSKIRGLIVGFIIASLLCSVFLVVRKMKFF